MLNRDALLAFLARKAKEAPVGDAPLLVQHAIYEGLAERVKAGEFDYVVNEDHDLVMDPDDRKDADA